MQTTECQNVSYAGIAEFLVDFVRHIVLVAKQHCDDEVLSGALKTATFYDRDQIVTNRCRHRLPSVLVVDVVQMLRVAVLAIPDAIVKHVGSVVATLIVATIDDWLKVLEETDAVADLKSCAACRDYGIEIFDVVGSAI